jgi:hypothetical protein
LKFFLKSTGWLSVGRFSQLKVILACLTFLPLYCLAQTGGPPMLTDDPGTVPPGQWEVNTSIVSDIGTEREFQIPLLDVNYGLNNRAQCKIEMPYIVSENENAFGGPSVGVKYRFLEADSQRILISTYPQVMFPIHKNQSMDYKLPLQFEFHLRKFILGEEVGFISEDKKNYLFSGTLGGVNLTNKFELMAELYFIWKAADVSITDSRINAGFRYLFNDRISLLVSAGSGRTIEDGSRTNNFFSYTGIRLLFY